MEYMQGDCFGGTRCGVVVALTVHKPQLLYLTGPLPSVSTILKREISAVTKTLS